MLNDPGHVKMLFIGSDTILVLVSLFYMILTHSGSLNHVYVWELVCCNNLSHCHPFQTYTVYYHYIPDNLNAHKVVSMANKKTTKDTSIIIDGLHSCEVYLFRVAIDNCSLSDTISNRTNPGILLYAFKYLTVSLFTLTCIETSNFILNSALCSDPVPWLCYKD